MSKLEDTLFCEKELVEELIKLKVLSVSISKSFTSTQKFAKKTVEQIFEVEFLDAKSRFDPYKQVGVNVFSSKASVKLAFIDYVIDFTGCFHSEMRQQVEEGELISEEEGEEKQEEENKHKTPLYDGNGNFYFCDLVGGPGGFTEYIFFKLKEKAFG